MKKYFCTLFDENYLTRGLALHASIDRWHKEYQLWILCMSDEAYHILKQMDLPNTELITLAEFEDTELIRVKQDRTHQEYCWTVTPSLPLYVLKMHPEIPHIAYIDSDCFFYSEADSLWQEMSIENKDVLIIEHRFSNGYEHLINTSGRFNVGLLIFNNNSKGNEVLNWWRDKCNEWCYYRHEPGRMGDQVYLDQWPNLFSQVKISNNIGACVAPWNIKSYRLSADIKNNVFVDSIHPLVFYHFHALVIYVDGTYLPARGYEFNTETIKYIYEPYIYELNEALKRVQGISSDFAKGMSNKGENTNSVLVKVKNVLKRKLNGLRSTVGQLAPTKECEICKSNSKLLYQGMYDDRYGYPRKYDLYRCTSCHHVFSTAVSDSLDFEALYTNYYPRKGVRASNVRGVTYNNGWTSWLNGEKRAFALVKPESRVLDIGCGLGETLIFHKSRNCKAYGLEADHNVKEIAEELGLNVFIGPIRESGYKKGYFDFITLDQVIEHIPNPAAYLLELKEYLAPNGQIVITTPNSSGWGTFLFGKKWINWHIPYHLHFFTKKSLQQIAKSSGLAVKECKTVTSSEWTRYQLIHLLYSGSNGIPSPFWSTKNDGRTRIKELLLKLINIVAKLKVTHLTTRVTDSIGVGDNFLVRLSREE